VTQQINAKPPEVKPLVLAEGESAFMFYGPPGSGKTTAAIEVLRNMPEDKRALVFDMDRKLSSMTNLKPELVARVDVWQPTATLSGTNQINVARVERKDDKGKVIPGTQGFIPPDPRGYLELVDAINSVISNPNPAHGLYVLDTFTTTVEHLQRLICHHHQVSSFSQQLWGVFATNVEEFRAGFLSLPGKRILICHAFTREDELTKEIRTLPSVPGQSAEKLPKDFNEVYFFEGRGTTGKYRVLTTASRRYVARTTRGFAVEEDLDTVLKKV
jgi:AAA domain